MPISGVVIKCHPGKAKELAATLHRPGEVEIQQVIDQSTLTAIIEAPTVADEVEVTKGIMAVDGVVIVQLAYPLLSHSF